MRSTTGLLLAAALLPLGGPAQAADRGFYLSAGVGRAEEDPGNSNGINIAFGLPPNADVIHLQPDSVDVDNGDTAWSLGAGYRFSKHLAAEVEYLDLGTTDYAEHYSFDSPLYVDTGIITHNYSSSLTGISVSLLGSLPVGRDFALFLRGGALFAEREVEVPLSLGGGDITYGDTLWVAGAGVDWSLSKTWGLRAEYQRTDDFGGTLTAGEASADCISLRVRFGF